MGAFECPVVLFTSRQMSMVLCCPDLENDPGNILTTGPIDHVPGRKSKFPSMPFIQLSTMVSVWAAELQSK